MTYLWSFCPYHVHPIFEHLLVYWDLFALPALRVNLMWTFCNQDRWRQQKNGWNLCSVMCAVIDMLTLSFQAAASKSHLAALIGFSGVCGFIWQPYLRQSLFPSMLRTAFSWNLCRLQWISPVIVDAAVVMIMWHVSAGRAVLKTCRHPKKHLLNLTRRQRRCCTV